MDFLVIIGVGCGLAAAFLAVKKTMQVMINR